MAKKLEFNFDKLSHEVLSKMGYIFVKQARDNMQKISSGRVYRVNGRNHTASKPGDTANSLSGNLATTIRYDISGNSMEFGAGDATVDYAKYLEGKMNRPNIVKSIQQNKSEVSRMVAKLFKDSLRKSND